MHAPKECLRLCAVLFIIGLPLAANAADDPSAVGAVDRVENEARIVAGETVTPAKIGTPVHLRDELRTGPEGRLRVTFRDDTVLTLGEKASVVIDRYVYDPDRNVGETLIQTTKGAFLFASGRIKGLKQHNIAVSTPVADIGVRGTQFWGGPLEKYGVVVLEGEITVSNQAGKVTLSGAGQGTDIPSPLDPPGEVKPWSPEKIARAVATVALH
ncbi:MAG: FecR family protein [Methyloceanibacter sp.]